VVQGTATFERSTLSHNSAQGGSAGTDGAGVAQAHGTSMGGGLWLSGAAGPHLATVVLQNATVSGNDAGEGGGIYVPAGSGGLTVRNSTIAENLAITASGGGIRNLGTAGLVSTIVADNYALTQGRDLHGAFTANNSLVSNDSDAVLTGAGNQVDVDPLLGPLAYNGGPTQTHALRTGSPAINQGSNPQVLTSDQRGAPWPREVGATDVGAFELGTTYVAAGKQTASFNDAAGKPVTVRMKGLGTAYVYVPPTGDTFIQVQDSDGKSALTITAASGANLGGLGVDGSLKQLTGTGATLTGNMDVAGRVDKLSLSAVNGPCTITMAQASAKGADLRFGEVEDLSLAVPVIKGITATSWTDGDGLRDFIEADVLSSAKITGWLEGVSIFCTQSVGKMDLGGAWNAGIYAGARPGIPGLAFPNVDFDNPGTVASVRIRGAVNDAGNSVINSNIAAQTISRVDLLNVRSVNGGVPFGLAANLVSRLSITDPAGKVSFSNLAESSQGMREDDLCVRLA